MGYALLEHLPERLDDPLLEGRVLALRPPFRHLREARLAEMRVEYLIVALVWREEQRQILDPAAPQGTGEVVHGLIREVGTEDRRDGVERNIWVRIRMSCGRLETQGCVPFFTR